jgi:hypothetical protein
MRPYRLALARRAQLRAEYRKYGMHLVIPPPVPGIPTRSLVLQPVTIQSCVSRALARRLAALSS